ncbi:MAG: hypothetical protein AB8E15_09600 [Bdellovibrionales bacterium]
MKNLIFLSIFFIGLNAFTGQVSDYGFKTFDQKPWSDLETFRLVSRSFENKNDIGYVVKTNKIRLNLTTEKEGGEEIREKLLFIESVDRKVSWARLEVFVDDTNIPYIDLYGPKSKLEVAKNQYLSAIKQKGKVLIFSSQHDHLKFIASFTGEEGVRDLRRKPEFYDEYPLYLNASSLVPEGVLGSGKIKEKVDWQCHYRIGINGVDFPEDIDWFGGSIPKEVYLNGLKVVSEIEGITELGFDKVKRGQFFSGHPLIIKIDPDKIAFTVDIIDYDLLSPNDVVTEKEEFELDISQLNFTLIQSPGENPLAASFWQAHPIVVELKNSSIEFFIDKLCE